MATIFPKVSVFRRGYDCDTVDQFFQESRSAYEGGISADRFSAHQVQQASFQLRRGGYETRAVDSALNRLEAAFVQRDRVDFIAVNGEAEWFARITDWATSLYPRLLRPVGQRFSHPARGERGYSTEQVDQVLDSLTAYFDEQQQLDVGDIRYAMFKSARGDKAYDEAQVDAYLSRVIEILLAVA